MKPKNKPEDYMYDSSDAEWSDETMSDYWKSIDVELDKRLGFKKEAKIYKKKSYPSSKKKVNKSCRKKAKEWTPEDTKRLYPNLTEEEAKKAWEMGW